MQATDADPEKIKTALWEVVNAAQVSDNIFTTNRPSSSDLDDFVVVDVNGPVRDYQGYARCVCMVQLFAKDIDARGTEDMTRLSQMYAALLEGLPADRGAYRFTKLNQAGRRDSLGFHATLVNLDCLIY